MSRTLLFVLLLLPLATLAQSTVYRTTDNQGNVIFTDTPPADGGDSEQVDIPRVNTAPPPPDIPRPVEAEPAEPEAPAPAVTITSPANETTIPMGPGNFSVSANVQPELQDGQRLQLKLDGEPRGEPQTGSNWDLTNVFRGQHDLTVSVLDAEGETVTTSEPVRVYVLRPSINNPNRARPPATSVN